MTNKILSVGLICLDIVVECEKYPLEDSDQRCQDLQWRRGGNASNNCSVFSQFDMPCEFLGNFSDDIPGRFLMEDISSRNIDVKNCVVIENGKCPTSYVILNSENGTRTIVHHRKNFPEIHSEDFLKLNLEEYSWLHFEGRNVDELKKILAHANKWKCDTGSTVPISIEIEKAIHKKLELLSFGDYIFMDKVFAQMFGYKNMEEAVLGVSDKIKPGGVVICAWGELGATARCADGSLVFSPSFPPNKIVDTLGAGDTFVASTIYALHQGFTVKEAITFGCQIAGTKCGIKGFFELREAYNARNFTDSNVL